MPEPTIASRLQRRVIVISTDMELVESLRGALAPDWALAVVLELESLGGFHEILQHRFMLLDLDAHGGIDPLDLIAEVRGELMLNIPIFCFGGDARLRDAARLARADRFFERGEIVARLPQFCEQFGWGG